MDLRIHRRRVSLFFLHPPDPFRCSVGIAIVARSYYIDAERCRDADFLRCRDNREIERKARGEGKRRAIYSAGSNVESSEKREILNGRERCLTVFATGKQKGREGRRSIDEVGEKFGKRKRVGW